MSADLVSVIVVTRNEADRIDRCLESLFRTCKGGPPFEVLLVDSNSTDETVDIARGYPIDVYQIVDEELVSPAAGRYVGASFAGGDRLLFVDGDMELRPGWLDQALQTLDDPDVAGVTGHLSDGIGADPPLPDENNVLNGFGGLAMYDVSAYRRVGGFDPFLKGNADQELGHRLTAAGYDLVLLPLVAATHPLPQTRLDSVREIGRRWRNRYFKGIGQVVRKHATNRTILKMHFRRERRALLEACWIVVTVLIIVASIVRSRRSLIAWFVLTIAGVVRGYTRSDRSLRGELITRGVTLPQSVGVLQGVLTSLPDEPFPMDSVVPVEKTSVQPHREPKLP